MERDDICVSVGIWVMRGVLPASAACVAETEARDGVEMEEEEVVEEGRGRVECDSSIDVGTIVELGSVRETAGVVDAITVVSG